MTRHPARGTRHFLLPSAPNLDPLTHTLVGANLASTRLGRTTSLATAALVIGANLPDVDSILYFTGHQDLALGFRRGWTHGVLALVVLPLIQTAVLIAFARWRKIAVAPRWLLVLSFVAILTHPFLDWLNNYGMRWLMPFRGTWFYGDSVYIMDPALWLILGCGWLVGRRPTKTLIGASMYICTRLGIHYATAMRVRSVIPQTERLMAAPHPIDPLRWDVVAQTPGGYRFGRYHWTDGGLSLAPEVLPLPQDTPEWREARADPSVRGFVTWMRFPWYEIERRSDGTYVLIHDARYAVRRRPGGGLGGVEVRIR